MIVLTAIAVGVIFAAAVYLMTGPELKSICMGVFLLGHGAHLAIITSSRSPIGLRAPVLDGYTPIGDMVDPLPQALILTSIVIGFAIQALLLTMLVVTWRRTRTLDIEELREPPHE